MLVSRYAETFPGKPEQVARVRSEVHAHLAGCPAADDVVLIVSEFASNAVLHSLSRAGEFGVRVELYPGYLWLEIEDEGGDWICLPQDDRPHGLDIVSLIAGPDNWGVDPVSGGHRVVWARVKW